MDCVLKTEKLVKSYGGKIAVKDMNMCVRRGDIYGIVGENGAGKTTLMRIVSGMTLPDSGNIELFESKELSKQRKKMGALIESPAFYPNMTAKENLEFFRRLNGIEEKKYIEEALKIVELSCTENKKARDFSLGMKQRLGIAISLLGNPEFLILDEPINGLDISGVKEIRELLLKLNYEKGITILISSHILTELSRVANRFGIVNKGVLVDEFSIEELEKRCSSGIAIKVDDVIRASEVLENIINIKNYKIQEGNTIRVFCDVEKSGYINTQLVKNDIVVSSISGVSQDLESYYLNLKGGKHE